MVMPLVPDDVPVSIPEFRYSKALAGGNPPPNKEDSIILMKMIFNPEVAYSRLSSSLSYKIIHIMIDGKSICNKIKNNNRHLEPVYIDIWYKAVSDIDGTYGRYRACSICKKKYTSLSEYIS